MYEKPGKLYWVYIDERSRRARRAAPRARSRRLHQTLPGGPAGLSRALQGGRRCRPARAYAQALAARLEDRTDREAQSHLAGSVLGSAGGGGLRGLKGVPEYRRGRSRITEAPTLRAGSSVSGNASIRQLVFRELGAQVLLGDLAGRGHGEGVDEHDVGGELPLGDLARQHVQNLRLGRVGAGGLHRHQQGALVPPGMGNADHRAVGEALAGERRVLHVDGADPLAARLYEILGAVDDDEPAVGRDLGDVAGGEPALPVDLPGGGLRVVEVARHDRRAAHEQFARGLAVRRRAPALVVDHLELDAEHAPALPGGERGPLQRRLGAL